LWVTLPPFRRRTFNGNSAPKMSAISQVFNLAAPSPPTPSNFHLRNRFAKNRPP